ncbi:hypothetical protein B0H19DRAFT_1084683 [Mycena capillaripes]|nr:hypothetical protein B0H19DRAFT_1084683 [Mycena capillaripes]
MPDQSADRWLQGNLTPTVAHQQAGCRIAQQPRSRQARVVNDRCTLEWSIRSEVNIFTVVRATVERVTAFDLPTANPGGVVVGCGIHSPNGVYTSPLKSFESLHQKVFDRAVQDPLPKFWVPWDVFSRSRLAQCSKSGMSGMRLMPLGHNPSNCEY